MEAAPDGTLWQLETNIDDMNPEWLAHVLDRAMEAGAVDAFASPAQMKKGRPGTWFVAVVPEARIDEVEEVLFTETSTLGIRRFRVERTVLEREAVTVRTPWGDVKAKRAWQGNAWKVAPEYEDAARLAREHGVPLRRIYEVVAAESGRLGGPVR